MTNKENIKNAVNTIYNQYKETYYNKVLNIH